MMYLRVFFAQLKHSHCKTNILGEETRRTWHENPKYTYLEKQYGQVIHVDVYYSQVTQCAYN
jgi:hypothetical protein